MTALRPAPYGRRIGVPRPIRLEIRAMLRALVEAPTATHRGEKR